MKFSQIFAAMLMAPFAALAAPKCTPGKVYCGKVLLDAGDYTEAQLADLIEKDVGNGSVPAVDVALFTCLEAGNEIEYEGSFCLCECVGSDNPDEVCSRMFSKTIQVHYVPLTQNLACPAPDSL